MLGNTNVDDQRLLATMIAVISRLFELVTAAHGHSL